MSKNKNFSVQSRLIQATALKAVGKYKEASELLEAALKDYPDDKQLANLLKRIDLLFKVKGS